MSCLQFKKSSSSRIPQKRLQTHLSRMFRLWEHQRGDKMNYLKYVILKSIRRTLQNLITEYDTYIIENRKKVFK